LNVFLIFKARSLSFIPKFFIDGMCGWYFVFFLLRVCAAKLSLQYVNNVNCMMSYGVGAYDRGGGGCTGGVICTTIHHMYMVVVILPLYFLEVVHCIFLRS